MAKLAAGIGTSHVPSIGAVIDNGKQDTPAWKPLFDAYKPVKSWLSDDAEIDVVIVIYNDHACDFSFSKYPTFAVGNSSEYAIADEGFGVRPLPSIKGVPAFSAHICRHLVYEEEFDITICRDMAVEHGLLVPMDLCFPHEGTGDNDWPVKVVPIQVNVLQHPIPTALRCYKLGMALRRAVETYDEDINVAIMGTGGMSHQLHGERFGYLNEKFDNWFLDTIESDPQAICDMTHFDLMENAGAEAVELIMWLTMRGAMTPDVKRVHKNYYAPMTTGMGLITFQDAT